jgi:hypothetical protein
MRTVLEGGGKRALVVSLLLALPILGSPASAQDDVREIAARVHREGGYGERLSVTDGEGGPRIVFGGGRRDAREPAEPDARRDAPSPGMIDVPPGSSWVAYVLLAVAIVVVVVLLVGVLARARTGGGELAPAHVRSRPAPAPHLGRNLAELEGDPDALAGAGRYAEAIGAAMIRGLRAVGWRPEGHMRSRTAREILASVEPSDARRAALAELVRIEERVAFGGDEATRERWDEARSRWLEIGIGDA